MDIIIYIILVLSAFWAYKKHKLTFTGSVTGFIIGFVIYTGGGLLSFILLTTFFVLASWATGWHKNKKIDHSDPAPRTAGQVLANGGVAALLGGLAWLNPEYSTIAQIMIAGSFAAATADTLSSEMGMIYGKRFVNIITLKKDQRGLDGVVSLEGTLIGMAGAAVIAILFWLFNHPGMAIPVIIFAGVLGNLADSILGATLERKNLIGNNTVNFLNTLVGAAACYLWLA